jgi:hypothetical protein
MCGRFEIHGTLEIIAKIFQIDSMTFDISNPLLNSGGRYEKAELLGVHAM